MFIYSLRLTFKALSFEPYFSSRDGSLNLDHLLRLGAAGVLLDWETAEAVPEPKPNNVADVVEPWKVYGVERLFILNTRGGLSDNVNKRVRE